MSIELSDHFTTRRLLVFVLPTICALIITSLYSVADGFFVSRFAGASALAAVNIIAPVMMIASSFGMILGVGGSAYVAALLGRGDTLHGRRIFTGLVLIAAVFGVVCLLFGCICLAPVCRLIGVDSELLAQCEQYGYVCICALPLLVLQSVFDSFFVTAARPQMGVVTALVSGVLNIAGDVALVIVLGLGAFGAAIATLVSCAASTIISLVFFAGSRSPLRLTRPLLEFAAFGKIAWNGFSEFIGSVSGALVNILFNIQLLGIAGTAGVASYSAIIYAQFIFLAAVVGFCAGVEPVFSFNYGADNRVELRSLFKKTLTALTTLSALSLVAVFFLAPVVCSAFVGYDDELMGMSVQGLLIVALSFPFRAVSTFSSSLFTSLNNGSVSAAISFLRTFVLECGFVLVLPLVLGLQGVWLSIVFADICSSVICLALVFHYRGRYGYMRSGQV